MSFSQIQLLGNLGRDPEMTYTPDGIAVTKFSIAVSKKIKNNEEITWYNCVA
jgi:single-strand DNA-binding protein